MLVAILGSLILEGRWMFCRSGVDTEIDAVLPESSPGEGCCPDDDDERIAQLGLRVKRKKKIACMLACPGFPADDDEEEEEEVVHLLLYIPHYSGSVVCIRFKVYRTYM